MMWFQLKKKISQFNQQLFGTEAIIIIMNWEVADDNFIHFCPQCGSVAETVAYDLVLEASMKAQHFCQRNLLLHGSWRWLLTEFALFYGVSDAYTKLRY